MNLNFEFETPSNSSVRVELYFNTSCFYKTISGDLTLNWNKIVSLLGIKVHSLQAQYSACVPLFEKTDTSIQNTQIKISYLITRSI
jgi:hypothetical protein